MAGNKAYALVEMTASGEVWTVTLFRTKEEALARRAFEEGDSSWASHRKESGTRLVMSSGHAEVDDGPHCAQALVAMRDGYVERVEVYSNYETARERRAAIERELGDGYVVQHWEEGIR